VKMRSGRARLLGAGGQAQQLLQRGHRGSAQRRPRSIALLSFFRASSQNDSLARIEGNIQSIWGMSLIEAEAAWLAFVDDWSG